MNSPARILRDLLVQEDQATNLRDQKDWPACHASEGDGPDNMVTVYDASGELQGRLHVTGKVPEHYGIQIRVRSSESEVGYKKMSSLCRWMDQELYRNEITVDGVAYLVHSATKRTSVLPLGRDVNNSSRFLFTVNYTVTIAEF